MRLSPCVCKSPCVCRAAVQDRVARVPSGFAVLLFCIALVLLVAPGCADSGDGNSTNDAVADTDVGADGTSDGIPDGDRPCAAIALEDADNDGLPNGIEDRNANCVVDAGETDWQNADSDGDGLSDGDEDINGNGMVDPGEFDPLMSSTCQCGVPDGQQPLAAVCRQEFVSTFHAPGAVPDAGIQLALPEGSTLERHALGRAATWSLPNAEVLGWAIRLDPATEPSTVHSLALVGISGAGFTPIVESLSAPFETWSLRVPGDPRDLPPGLAVRAKVRIPLASPQSLSTVRDSMADAVATAPLEASVGAGPTCDEVVLWLTSVIQANGTTASLAAVTCGGPLSDARIFDLDNLTNVTQLAPAEPPRLYHPTDFQCENLAVAAESGLADILWVIDNSGSMEDEQTTVAATADLFRERLEVSGIDWRLGVSTTEAWGLDPVYESRVQGTFGHDELLDYASGLRGLGFLAATDDVPNLFGEYVTLDSGCVRNDLTPPPPADSNICGSGRESGLQSGLFVLEQLTGGTGDARHSVRPDATVLVVWVSDEEDQRCKDEGDGVVNEIVTAYQDLPNEVLACAVVGDDGVGNGGFCQPLGSNGVATTGAEPGRCYLDAATALGGPSGSVCNLDLSVTVEDCIGTLIQRLSSYTLSGWPISSSITVAIDGRQITRSRTAGWDYDHVENKIVFFGEQLALDSVVSVSYTKWRLAGG